MRAWIRWPFLKLEKVIQFSHKFASQKNRGCEPFVFPLMPGTLNSIAAIFWMSRKALRWRLLEPNLFFPYIS